MPNRSTASPIRSHILHNLLIYSLLVSMLVLLAHPAHAQETVTGTVVDAETNDPLPAANLEIEGTYTGTITGEDGQFALTPSSYPATLVVRFIGYDTYTRTIDAPPSEPITIALSPTTLDLDGVTVSPPDPDSLMAAVIQQKQTWWNDLESFEADAYSRFTVRNDTGIVSMQETHTRAFWRAADGFREIVLHDTSTANVEGPANDAFDGLPAALLVTNLYEDDVEVMGHTLRGVTHPDALDYYTFSLDSTRVLDDQRVYDLRVTPRSRLQSGFEGRISVLADESALIEAKLTPTESFMFPRPVQDATVRMEQQFSNFGGDAYVPVDFRATYTLDVGMTGLFSMPSLQVDQTSQISGYEINVSLPDSLFADTQQTRSDSTHVAWADARRPTATPPTARTVPLTADEDAALATIDSTDTLADAFEPSGPLSRVFDFNVSAGAESGAEGRASGLHSDVTPFGRYNRVEGGAAGLRTTLRWPGIAWPTRLRAEGGYRTQDTGASHWTYGGSLRTHLPLGLRLDASYHYGIDPLTDTRYYGRTLNTLWALNGVTDYFDYLGAERVRVGLQYRLRSLNSRVQVGYRGERQFSVGNGTNYDLWGRLDRFRANPTINDGTLHALTGAWTIGTVGQRVSVGGQRGASVRVTHADPAVNSDFDFTRLDGEVSLRVPTFFQRRLLSNALDVRAVAGGTVRGTAPLQEQGHIDTALVPYTPFGVLRAARHQPYRGDHYAGLMWEHTFRTVPFEMVGISNPPFALIVHGGHGRTWTDDATPTDALRSMDRWHHEVGLSLSGGLRIDVTARLDEPGWSLGLSTGRLF